MRFFRWRVWRAIPELDGLTRERAKGFVRSAKRQGRRRALRWTLVTVAALVAFIEVMCLAMPWAYSVRSSPDALLDKPSTLGWVWVALILIAPLVVGWMIQRWLVLRAARLSLAGRGRCAACGTALLGRPVADDGSLRCLVCDRVYHAEPAWDEVGLRGGERVFRPRVVERRTKLWEWWAFPIVAAVMGGVLPIVVSVLVFEVTVVVDAKAARRDRTGYAPVMTMADSLQPAGSTPTDPNAWDSIERARAVKERVDLEVWNNEEARRAHPEYEMPPEFGQYTRQYTGQKEYSNQEQFAAAQRLAAQMIEPYRAAGVFAELDAAVRQPRWELRWSGDPNLPIVSVNFPQLKVLREFAKIDGVRMRLAAVSGDVREFEAALAGVVSMSEISSEYPTAFGALVSIATESIAWREVRARLQQRPSGEWLDACERGLKLHRPRPSTEFYFESERMGSLDMLAFFFTWRSSVRSRALEGIVGDGQGSHPCVGFYGESKRVVEAAFAELMSAAKLERPKRPALRLDPHGLYFAAMTLKPLRVLLDTFDQAKLDDGGVRVMIALERYRLEHGEYPEQLDRLGRSAVESDLTDPWSGKWLCYRRRTAEEQNGNAGAWGYLLWSVGADGRDNGGLMVPDPEDRYRVLKPDRFGGYDFIINDLER